jgi:hypothetical protein
MNESPANPANPANPASSGTPPVPPAAAPTEAPPSPIAVERQVYLTHFELKTPDGQSYLEGGARKVVKADSEPLAQFLADAEVARGEGPQKREVRVSYYFGTVPAGQWRPMRFITPGILAAFETAAREFYRKAHGDQNLAQFQRQARLGFRLPDPELEPESYWLVGDRFNPRLIILWGCEKLDANKRPLPSLPLVPDPELFPQNPVTVLDKLKARLMSWEGTLQENLALVAEKKDALGRFLARPVYDKQHQRVIGLQPLLLPDTTYPIGRFRPLKRLPSGEIKAFDKAAEAYYAKAHEDADSLAQHPEVSAYERELRRNFRLPDVDTAAKPKAGLEGMEGLTDLDADKARKMAKSAKKIEAPPRVSYWVYGKKLYPRLMIAVEGNEPLAACLYLTRDAELDLPPGAKEQGALDDLGTDALLAGQPQTVTGKLQLRERTWIATSIRAAAALAVAGVLLFVFLQYIYVPLKPVAAKVAEDAKLDPANKRNLIAVDFNASVRRGSILSPRALKPGQVPSFVLQGLSAADTNAAGVAIIDVKPHVSNPKEVILYLDGSLPEGASYTLSMNAIRPAFGRPLKPNTQMPVDTRDTRPPAVKLVDAAPDSVQKLWVVFDEPLDSDSACRVENYALPGLKIVNAVLNKAQNVAILTASPAFTVDKKYTLTVHDVKDASRNKNVLKSQEITFDYRDRPPLIAENGVTANQGQLAVRVEFTKPLDQASATQPSNYDFGTNDLKIGSVKLSPDKQIVEITLTNSFLVPDRTYFFHFKGVKNLAGQPGEHSATFAYTGLPDRAPPVLVKLDDSDPRLTTLRLIFNKPVKGPGTTDGSMYLLEKDVNWNRNYEPMAVRFAVQHDRPEALSLILSEPLYKNLRYRLNWTNVEDLVGNTSASLKEFTPNPVGKPPSFTSAKPNKAKKSISLLVYYESKMEDSSFAKENFKVLNATTRAGVAVVKVEPPQVEIRSGDWRTEVELDLADLPSEVEVTWSGVKVEGNPQTYDLTQTFQFKQ